MLLNLARKLAGLPVKSLAPVSEGGESSLRSNIFLRKPITGKHLLAFLGGIALSSSQRTQQHA